MLREWEAARAAGLVVGELDELMARHLLRVTGQELPAGDRSTRDARGVLDLFAKVGELLVEWFSGAAVPGLATLQVVFQGSVVGALEDLFGRAIEADLDPKDFEKELEALRARYGGKGEIEPGSPADLLVRDELVLQAFTQAIAAFETEPEVRAVYPYQEYRIRGINTRENHAALDGFVWLTGWQTEPAILPPNGWNCFCRVRPITWSEANERGWTAPFPRGTSQLERFFALGGPDAGFPKDRFVSGLV